MGPRQSSSRGFVTNNSEPKKNERRDTTVSLLEECATTSSRRERIQSFIHDRNESDKTAASNRSRYPPSYPQLTSGTSHHHEGIHLILSPISIILLIMMI